MPNSMPPIPRGCSEKRLLALQCKWGDCDKTLAVPVGSYQDFAEHVFGHVSEYLSSIGLSKQDIENHITSNENSAEWSLMTPLACNWSECHWEVRGSPDEYCRHVLFHAYHTRLKCLGAFAVISEGLRQCSFDVETQNLLPDLSEPFLCRWESCGMQFLCPDKFYRHVDIHGHAAHREDVLVTTGEKAKEETAGTNDKDIEGLHVQTMTQSVCRWEGCSYLARDPWKVKEHCRIHTGEKLVACPSCGLFFSNKTKLTDHLIRQDSTLYEHFQCSHCLKRCASERLLRDHMRHHVNHVKCPHCDMTCPNPSSLRSHLTFKHSLDRPFKCSMCNFCSKTKYDLARHEATHFDKKLYCEVEGCPYECKTLAALRGHIKVVHERNGVKQFICHICKKTFSRGFLLTRHLKKEHHFSWPSGHSRFRYKLDEDGFYRLQMVRFESAELTEQLTRENPDIDGLCSSLESNENSAENETAIKDNHPMEERSATFVEELSLISSNQANSMIQSPEMSTLSSANEQDIEAVSVSLNDRYEALLRLYEMAKDNENPGIVPMGELAHAEKETGPLGAQEHLSDENDLECYGKRNKRKMTMSIKSSTKKLKTFQ